MVLKVLQEESLSLIATTSSLSDAMPSEALFKVSGRYLMIIIKLTTEKALITRLGNR